MTCVVIPLCAPGETEGHVEKSGAHWGAGRSCCGCGRRVECRLPRRRFGARPGVGSKCHCSEMGSPAMCWLGGASTHLLLPVWAEGFSGWETGSAEPLGLVAFSPSPGQGRAPASSSGRVEGRGRDAGAEALALCSSCFASWWDARFSNAGQGEV